MLTSYKRMGVDMRGTILRVIRVIIFLVVLLVLVELISYFITSNVTDSMDWQIFLAASLNFFTLLLFVAFFVGVIWCIFSCINRPKSVEGKVKKLAKLKEAGIINEEEFEARKHNLLDQL